MRRILAVCSVVGLLACAGFAQAPQPAQNQRMTGQSALSTDSSDSADTIKALMQEVKELKARVAALEARQAQPSPEQPSSAKPAVAAETMKQEGPSSEGQTTNPEPVTGLFPGIRMSGFGALSYKATDARPPEAGLLGFRSNLNSNFAVGDVDLFLTSHLTSKASVLSEVVFSENSEKEFELDVERLLLKYDFNDYLKLSFGRYHTATSYYNSVFHHGQWLQTAADRPLVVEFSDHGGLLPSQGVGVSITGKLPSGSLGLNYIFEYGSSDIHRPNILDPNADDIVENNGHATTAGLFARPDWLQGLEVGGSFYHDRINPDGGPFHLGQSIGSAHVVYLTPRFEFLNEGFIIQHIIEDRKSVV